MTRTDEFDAQQFVKSIYELLVLGTLRDGPLHGYQIAIEVEHRSGGRFVLKHGTLYPILHRLERGGLIEGEWSATEGGRRRKSYALTRAGRSHLDAEADRARSVFGTLLDLVGGSEDEPVRGAAG